METLNKSFQQARDLFLSMTPAARVMAALMIVVIFVSFGYLFKQGTSGPDSLLFGGEFMQSSQLRKIDAALSKAGLSGYKIESHRVRVPRGKEAEYVAAIAEGDAMPADFHLILDKAISAGGVFGSKEQNKERTKAAREHQLSLIIGAMQGIEEAFVMFHESKERTSLSPTLRSRVVTATVSLQAAVEGALDAKRVKMIQRLVASAIGGKPENVTVANVSGGEVYGGTDNASNAAEDDPYLQRQMLVENRMRTKILQGVVAGIPGVRVAVSAELDSVSAKTTSSVTLDDKPVTLSTTSRDETNNSNKPQNGGTVGQVANSAIGPNGLGGAPASRTASGGTTSSTSLVEETAGKVVGHTEVRSHEIGFIPKRVTATIRIPSNYWVQIWKEQNKPAEGADPKKPTPVELSQLAETVSRDIEKTVATLLGEKVEGENIFAKVDVSTYQSLTPAPIEGPSLAQNAMAWTSSNWPTLGMFGLAGIGLIMLRSVIKGVPSPAPSSPSASTFEIDGESDEEGNEDENGRPKLRLRKGESLKDDLADMVREDPDAAASILRSWIGEAS